VLLLDEGVFTFHAAIISTSRACTSWTVSECYEEKEGYSIAKRLRK